MHEKGFSCPLYLETIEFRRTETTLSPACVKVSDWTYSQKTQVLIQPNLTLNRNNTQGIERYNSIKSAMRAYDTSNIDLKEKG
jgi:hypothetical protein